MKKLVYSFNFCTYDRPPGGASTREVFLAIPSIVLLFIWRSIIAFLGLLAFQFFESEESSNWLSSSNDNSRDDIKKIMKTCCWGFIIRISLARMKRALKLICN